MYLMFKGRETERHE